MAGFREFLTGEVLTAANVDDFLMKQSVQKYADAAARDAALGTAVAGGNALREGMVAWLDDTNSVIAYDGTAWNPVGAEPPAGIGSNVVQSVKTTQQVISSTSFVDITDLSVTITPSSDSSKILVLFNLYLSHSNPDGQFSVFNLVRNSTEIFVGTTGSGVDSTALNQGFTLTGNDAGQFVDSPATASAVTYKLQARATGTGGGSFTTVNRPGNSTAFTTASSITAIEVAA